MSLVKVTSKWTLCGYKKTHLDWIQPCMTTPGKSQRLLLMSLTVEPWVQHKDPGCLQGRYDLGEVLPLLRAYSSMHTWNPSLKLHHCLVVYSLCCVQLFCDPMDCSPPGSPVDGISQARILEWVVISSLKGSFWLRDWTHISCIGKQILYHWATREVPVVLLGCF